MFHIKTHRFLVIILILVLFPAACSTAGPTRIASYPSEGRGNSGARPGESFSQLIYNASLEIDVSNPGEAVDRARDLAYKYGGYLVSSQSWQLNGKEEYLLVLEVPARDFDAFLGDLHRLGSVESEHISGEWVRDDPPGWDCYSQVSLHLRAASFAWPSVDIPRWRPIRTLERAFGFSVSILAGLLDILIWILVVTGPFLLLGWLAVRLVRRLRR